MHRPSRQSSWQRQKLVGPSLLTEKDTVNNTAILRKDLPPPAMRRIAETMEPAENDT